jgi:terminase large subunit-like protein
MSDLKNKTVLRPYQRRWVNDKSRLTLAVKAAQIGYSTASAAWAVITSLARPKQLVVLLSRSERQSLELAEKCKRWVDGYQGVMADYFPRQTFRQGIGSRSGGIPNPESRIPDPKSRTPNPATSMLQHEIRFPNQSRIIALAANPDTARGYTGHVLLDEFAFHSDAEAIFKAAYRQTTLGYKLKVLSTPNGQQGKFWELAKSLGLDLGVRPRRQPVRAANRPERSVGPQGEILRFAQNDGVRSPWSGHWSDIYLAVEEGLPLRLEEVRSGCDEETWLQEYCCQFVSQASEWISPELLSACTSSEASADYADYAESTSVKSAQSADLYAGWDIARKRDLSVIWISELVGDVTWTRGVIEMPRMSTVEQIREARALLSGKTSFVLSPSSFAKDQGQMTKDEGPRTFLRRMSIDKSGMGLAMVEQLEREFPDQVEGVEFTAAVKERLAVLARRRMEEGKVRLPDLASARHAFRAVRKSVNSGGQSRFDAGHDSEYGHADHFWAFALAEAAAEAARRPSADGPPSSPVFVGTPREDEMLPAAMENVF